MRGLLDMVLGWLWLPVAELLDPTSRIYWVFALVSLLVAWIVMLAKGLGAKRSLHAAVGPSVWTHRSALADYRLIAARGVLKALTYGAYGLSTVAIAAISVHMLRTNIGLPNFRLSALAIGALFTLTAFVVEDWSRFIVHKWMHNNRFLWEFHKIHHSAEVLTPLTLYRTHPVEAVINSGRSAVVIGLTTGVFSWLFGPKLYAWQIVGVDALGFVWTLLGANLRHSHVWLSYGKKAEHLLMSPAQHQIHHSVEPRHYNKNFGTVFSVWDWLAGSLYVTAEREKLQFGLPKNEDPYGNNVTAMLIGPFISIGKKLGIHKFIPQPSTRRTPRTGVSVMLILLALVLGSCTSSKRIDRVQLLTSLGRCTIDIYTRFQMSADALVTATSNYATTPNDQTRNAARTAWENAIDLWQQAEMHHYGPAAEVTTPGGAGHRINIYSWPDVNRCLIEEQLVSRAYEGTGFPNLSNSTRGLAAVELLLYHTGPENGCGPTSTINTNGTWAALSLTELNQRRAQYAHAAAVDVAARARALLTAWEPNGFLAQLTTAGMGSTLFSTQQIALSAVAEGAFYLDTDVKDLRLGVPLGLYNCTTGNCPDVPTAFESQWAHRGRIHLRNQLLGLRAILEGCTAGNQLAFDDLLESAGAAMLATHMRTDIQNAIAAVDALPSDDLVQSLSMNRAAVVAVHTAIRAITTFFKTEFTVTLQIQSQRVEGDND